jgi:hypothetical protein
MPRETDLYAPVKEYLLNQGFTVRGEVRDCDLAAVKNGELLVVELKVAFNLDLVIQGNERKRICDNVYLAIPQPKNLHSPHWLKKIRLCRALGLGLLAVSPGGAVQPLCHPVVKLPAKSSRQKELLIKEFQGRSGDYNTGGSGRRPLVTVYREQALRIARFIGPSQQRPKDIVAATGIAAAPGILQKNYYGWFQRVERGVYCLSTLGHQALQDYADILNRQA